MWPLSGIEVVRACAVGTWSSTIESLSIGGVSSGEWPPLADDLFVALREDGYDGHVHVEEALEAGAALALVSADWDGRHRLAPELRARSLVVDDSLRAFRRLAAFLRGRFSFPVVAVGGSNGKTTTKDMIAALLSGPRFRVTSTPETMNGWSGLPVTLAQRGHSRALPPHALVVEIGIDALNPLEVKAGMDPIALKKKYGKQLVFQGGINAVLWDKPDAILAEMKRVIPVMKRKGGYIFSSDHSVPSSVSLKDFQRIINAAKELGRY